MADDIRKLYGDARFVLRKDSLENWQTKNPVLLEGEPSYVTDGEDGKKIKFGDGITPWNDLDYFSAAADVEVDQTYNPESENAQSGKAVAEGISKETKDKISVWQPNTEYKVGDVVVANFRDSDLFDPEENLNRMVIAKCVRQHKSDSFFDLTNLEIETAWEILQETYAYYDALGNRIHNTYATKNELNEVAESISRWKAKTSYEVGDTVLIYYINEKIDRMYRCKISHTSSASITPTELKQKWEEVFLAPRAVADSEGNNIIDTYAMLSNLVKFKIAKLAPNETFDIKPNMLIMAMAENDDKCITYYTKDGDGNRVDRVQKATMVLFFTTKSNKEVEGAIQEKLFNSMYRVGCMYYTGDLSGILTGNSPFGTKNNFVAGPEIINESSTKNVYVYYIEQGKV